MNTEAMQVFQLFEKCYNKIQLLKKKVVLSQLFLSYIIRDLKILWSLGQFASLGCVGIWNCSPMFKGKKTGAQRDANKKMIMNKISQFGA